MSGNAAVAALIPVKPLQSGKGRLGAVLDSASRARLVRAMLADLLDALAGVQQVQTRWVVSRDAEVLALAASVGARALPEPEAAGGLNGALEWARRRIAPIAEPGSLLVLPADLPGATPRDLEEFLRESETGSEALVRLCPSPDGGTNALLLRPPDAIPFAYGPRSADAHTQLAVARGIQVERCSPPGLQLDVDGPDDLRARVRRLKHVPGSRTRATLAALGVAAREDG